MARTTTIRNLILGEGQPKICVPIVGSNKEEVYKAAETIRSCRPDMAEWRADYVPEIRSAVLVQELLKQLRTILGEIPLLFTFRTAAEGGEQSITLEEYRTLYKIVLESRLVDAIDVELFLGEQTMRELIMLAQEKGIRVIASNHDFVKTPKKEELFQRLCTMQKLGADIAKIAVMPTDKKDVLTLLEATYEAEQAGIGPIITMSMGKCGMVSRLLGETFGSALTFATAGRASAPGQIPLEEMREFLNLIHKNS